MGMIHFRRRQMSSFQNLSTITIGRLFSFAKAKVISQRLIGGQGSYRRRGAANDTPMGDELGVNV